MKLLPPKGIPSVEIRMVLLGNKLDYSDNQIQAMMLPFMTP
jgi:hypothetical protein